MELCRIVMFETRDFKMDLFVLLFNESVTAYYPVKMSPFRNDENDNEHLLRYG